MFGYNVELSLSYSFGLDHSHQEVNKRVLKNYLIYVLNSLGNDYLLLLWHLRGSAGHFVSRRAYQAPNTRSAGVMVK